MPTRKHSHPPRPAKPQPATGPAPLLHTRFSTAQLLRQFRQLLPLRMLASWLALQNHTFYSRAFTPLITLWYLIFQRLNENHHLSHALQDALAGGADRLSARGKALSGQLHSQATTSLSDARQRLPLEICHQTLRHTAAQTAAAIEVPRRWGFKVGLMDGTTVRTRPFKDMPKHFPPHRPGNCKKQPYWCLARAVGLLCLASGVVLDCALGSLQVSEQALSASLLLQHPWPDWLLLADRNFGVYSVVRAAREVQAQVLFRLTRARAAKLARGAGFELAPGLDVRLSWHPSRHDQCPQGLSRTPVQGRLLVVGIQRPGKRPLTLFLFTTLLDQTQYPAQELAKIYAQRWNIELCFRYIKAQMDLGFLECQSADMLRKEWLAGLVAYNLIRWTMAAAAALAQIPVQGLSFSRAREFLLGWCLRSAGHNQARSWAQLLARVAQARLPKRSKPRPAEPRATRPFQKDVAKLLGSRALARQKLAEGNVNS